MIINAKYDAELAALEKQTPSGIKETTPNVEGDWSKDVESTAKALEKVEKSKGKAVVSGFLRARQVNEDGSIEPMAYITERINNKSQATLTNEKLVEGYIGNEDNTLKRTNVDENPNQTHIHQ